MMNTITVDTKKLDQVNRAKLANDSSKKMTGVYQEDYGDYQTYAPDTYSPFYDPDAAKNRQQQDINDEFNYGGHPSTDQGRQNKSNEKMTTGTRPTWDNGWKAFTFERVGKSIVGPGSTSEEVTLFINPESFTQAEPARITVTQTKGGFFVDNFGAGIKSITIQGVTGYKQRDLGGRKLSGQEQFIEFRQLYRDWLEASKTDPDNNHMRFYNWADKEYYEVAITQFTLQRTTQRPLLYQYNIQMTAVQKLDQPSRAHAFAIGDTEDLTKYLLDEQLRTPLIADQLDSSLGIITDISNGVGLENFSKSVTAFSKSLAKGLPYYDTVLGVYKTVDSVIGAVSTINREISNTVAGLSVFITTPFEQVKSLATSVSDVITSLCSIANIPHEVVRTFRDMQCALESIPQALFKGFTNPALFEGASNCGTTLGIAEAATADYRNSFTATAQIPFERAASKIFRIPTSILTLNEEPSNVIGVFLESDIERTGTNYLYSNSGTQVKLTAVPTVSVVVDYSVKQETTQNMISLKASAAYVVTVNDTLIRIALQFYNDASRWKDIALFNNLEYPYIMENLDFEKEIYATGTVRFYRTLGSSAEVIIPAGFSVYVPEHDGNLQIDFQVATTTALPLMVAYVDVPVEAVLAGAIGNVAPKVITGFNILTGITKVENISPTLGGKIWKIALPGDIIFIPQTERESFSTVVAPTVTDYDQLFGVDIGLTLLGEFDSGTGISKDLSMVNGVRNLVQALRSRMSTSKAYYPYSPNYGSNIPLYVGKRGLYNWYDRIKVEASSNILDDTRIRNIKNLTLSVTGDAVSVDFDAETIAEQSSLLMNVVI